MPWHRSAFCVARNLEHAPQQIGVPAEPRVAARKENFGAGCKAGSGAGLIYNLYV